MKNRIVILALSTLFAGTVISSCKSSEKKVEDAKENVVDAKEDVVEAKQELNQIIKDSIQQFRTESAIKIAEHEKSIAEFKVRIAKKKKENRAKYEEELQSLELKNSDLKKRLDEFKEDSQDNWYTFKSAFNRDMDELGESIKKVTTKDKK